MGLAAKVGPYAAAGLAALGALGLGADGEWAEPRFLTVQYQNIAGKTLDQFSDPRKIVILDPPQYSSGKVIHPYAEALK